MQEANYFFLIFFITIITTRLIIYIKPIPSPTIRGFRLHHYMLGLIILILGLIFSNITISAVGLGLFVDELTFIITRGKNHKDNYSKKSLIGTAIFIILVFMLRNQIINIII